MFEQNDTEPDRQTLVKLAWPKALELEDESLLHFFYDFPLFLAKNLVKHARYLNVFIKQPIAMRRCGACDEVFHLVAVFLVSLFVIFSFYFTGDSVSYKNRIIMLKLETLKNTLILFILFNQHNFFSS